MELCEEQQQVIVVSFVYKSYLLFVEFVVVCVTGSVYSCIIFWTVASVSESVFYKDIH